VQPDLGESLRGELHLTSTRPLLGSRRPRHWSASPSLRPAVLLGHRRTVPHPQTLVLLNQKSIPELLMPPVLVAGYAQGNLFDKMSAICMN
jgi:hypothetical protein